MKRVLFTLTVSLIWLSGVDSAWAQGSNAAFKSYREWKSEKVQEAQTRIDGLKVKLSDKKDPNMAKSTGTEATDVETAKIETQIRREEVSLETAKELTVSDYFAGYLTKLSDKKSAFKEVAGRLTAEEVAELMSAYADSVFGTQSSSLSPNAQGSADNLR